MGDPEHDGASLLIGADIEAPLEVTAFSDVPFGTLPCSVRKDVARPRAPAVLSAPEDLSSADPCPVNCHNEWDRLEEVIVGIVDGATFPPWHPSLEPVLPVQQHGTFRRFAGQPFPAEQVAAARAELEEFVTILEGEGVTVKRPESRPFGRTYKTLDWESSGLYAAMPRDVLLVFGNEIIECPLAWRSRYFETLSYRPLLKDYFRRRAKWSAAPKPELKDDLYDLNWNERRGRAVPLVVTEVEPTFDAADFIRCGRDIIAQLSNVTNSFGVEWLRRHLGDAYRIHIFEFADDHPMHIDATLAPLAPGKLLINPERVPIVPPLFKHWDILRAPTPVMPDDHILYMTSKWINMNILMLDPERVVVERQDEPMIKAMKQWGFKPILCNFRNFNSFGGSFHCATLDVRRTGGLESYFD